MCTSCPLTFLPYMHHGMCVHTCTGASAKKQKTRCYVWFISTSILWIGDRLGEAEQLTVARAERAVAYGSISARQRGLAGWW